MKFLRDPAWLALFVTVLIAVGTLAVYLKDQPVKKLRVEILSNSPLVSIDTAAAKDLQVLYKGVPVQTLSLILLKVANTGTEPIKESDYSEPIRVSLSQSAAVGEVSIQETRPDGIQLTPTVSATNQVELARVLLNPGDQAVVKILALNNDSTLKISARIVGIPTLDVQSILGRNDTTGVSLKDLVFGVLLAVLFLFLLAAFIWQTRRVIEWRRKRFGFDPARYYYTLAQSGVLTLPASKDAERASAALTGVVGNLDKAFAWDITYMERIKNDPLFSQLLGYEKYKDVIAKHKARTPDAPGATNRPPIGN